MKKLIMPLIALVVAVCLAVCVKISQQRQEVNNAPPVIEETTSPSHTAVSSPRPSHTTTGKTRHKCEVCGKTATHDELKDIGEYYCDEHWKEMEAIVNMMLD